MSNPDSPVRRVRETSQVPLRTLTQAAVLAAARARRGPSASWWRTTTRAPVAATRPRLAPRTPAPSSSASGARDGSTSNTGDAVDTGNTGYTGNTGSSRRRRAASSSTPTVTSGGTSDDGGAALREPVAAARSFRAIGTTATVVVQDAAAPTPRRACWATSSTAVDQACSRFRDDSELQAVHAEAGQTVEVSDAALRSLHVRRRRGRTHARGGRPHRRQRRSPPSATTPTSTRSAPGRRRRRRPSARSRATQHVQLDRADARSASRAASVSTSAPPPRRWPPTGPRPRSRGPIGAGVARQPRRRRRRVPVRHRPGGWAVGIARESSTPADQVDQVVAITHGGLASSATSVRTWKAGDRTSTTSSIRAPGDCVEPYWVLVSATGASCVEANLRHDRRHRVGRPTPGPPRRFDQSVRLCAPTGEVFSVNGWPAEAGGMNSTALWYATRASGLMALILLTLTMVLGITTTTRARARNWPGFAQQEMHRRISMLAVVFLGSTC